MVNVIKLVINQQLIAKLIRIFTKRFLVLCIPYNTSHRIKQLKKLRVVSVQFGLFFLTAPRKQCYHTYDCDKEEKHFLFSHLLLLL